MRYRLISAFLVAVLFVVASAQNAVATPDRGIGPVCEDTQRAVAEPAPAGKVAVVLSHGFTDSADGLQELGQQIESGLQGKGVVYYFDYGRDSDRWPAHHNIAACLGEFIHNISDANDAPVVYAAHSMGVRCLIPSGHGIQ